MTTVDKFQERKNNLLAIMERQMKTYQDLASQYALSALDAGTPGKEQEMKERARYELTRYNTMKLARDMVAANI